MKILHRFPELHVKRTSPVNLKNFNPRFFVKEEVLDAFKILEVSNVKCSPFGVVFKDGKVLEESVYSMFSANSHRWTFYKKSILGRVRYIEGTSLLCHNAYYANYYHWLTEALPRLFVCKDLLHECNLIVPKNLSSFHHESLSYFDFKNIYEVDENELVQCSKLILPMHTSRGLSHYEPVIKEMSKWYSKESKSKSELNDIHISRKNANRRFVVNEKEVRETLETHGVKEIYLEELSFKTQIELFNSGRLVVGPHGAGFSNMMFLPDKSKIICFMNEMHPDPAFINLASAFDHSFHLLLCKDSKFQSKGMNPQIYDLEVNIEELERSLERK